MLKMLYILSKVGFYRLTRRHGKSIHFHLFIFINVVATIVIFGFL